jgi:tryptophanyl-tRNA synthetase
MGKKNAKLYRQLRKRFTEQGDAEAIDVARALLEEQQNISLGDRERLFGYLEGVGKIILPEPKALLTKQSKMVGLDGQKMSKSYNNTISLREDPDSVDKRIRTMPTDPARVRRSDPGTPEKCPVWALHQVYSDDDLKQKIHEGCTTAGIGCLDCKRHIIDAVQAELQPIRERALEYKDDITAVQTIIDQGCESAREVARDTLDDVRKALGLIER